MTLGDEVKGDVVPNALMVDPSNEEVKDGATEKDVLKLIVAFREDLNVDEAEDYDSVLIVVYDVLEL